MTDEQLAELEALAETARAEGWQFVTPALRDAVPSLIAEVRRLRAMVAAERGRCVAILNAAREGEIDNDLRAIRSWIASGATTPQEKDHG